MNKGIIIGISGIAGSGKDTVASMLSILYDTNCNASFNDWNNRNIDKNKLYIMNQFHFADKLKDMCAEILDIGVDHFYDRDYKDNKYYVFGMRKFFDKNDYPKHIKIITIDDLNKVSLASYLNYTLDIGFTLRTFMQYIGTNVFRNQIYNNYWIDKTIKDCVNTSRRNGIALIPDVRFHNESEIIQRAGGKVIMVINDKITVGSHESEQLANINPNFTINNNGSLFTLFYKVKNLAMDMYY